jgi:hypothetical protein
MELVKLGFRTLQDVLQAGSDQLLDILKKLADGDSTLKRYRVMNQLYTHYGSFLIAFRWKQLRIEHIFVAYNHL